MKVTVRDNKILKTIEPQVLGEYLQTNGWHNEGLFYGRAWIWHKNSDKGELFEIKQPVSHNFDDYGVVMGDTIKKLEVTENRSQLEILSDLITSLDHTEIQGFVVKVDREEGEEIAKVAMMGFVVNKLRKIYVELKETDCNLALKAYQERIPVICGGDLVKVGGYFVMKNLHGFALMVEEAKGDEIAIARI
ncbi:MAG TPA: hypothetical protein DCS91_02325 [Microcoleaceae bacterium UBA11344]|jgi:hypothetical protein|nr:hypothetical protein [Microcoleaceae cyanobacterium UBA11344]